MARGWESKSVEDQQAEAAQRPAAPHARLTPEQAAGHRAREVLRMARLGVLKQLESASSPRYRTLLQDSLKQLDSKLEHLP
jgi:hypothetical protein